MTHYTFDPPINGIKQWDLSLDHELGRGANATVFKVQVGKSYYALKKYQQTSLVDIHKLKAMISNPPKLYTEYDEIDYPLFGWALSIVYSEGAPIGFLMPLVDSEKSKTLDFFYDNLLATKLQSDTSRALSFKIEILANLCEAISDLHDHGHQFVDLKPQNLRVFEGTNVVSLIDCDGYHITDQKTGNEFRAEMVSPDYVAPEINKLNLKLDRIPKSQDEYALAVIVFQMLNRGIHPYQGILNDEHLDANTNDKKALLGLFPYSQQNNDKIEPPPTSVFSFLLPETQKLFEDAFTKSRRPTAKKWAKHFRNILDQKLVVRCSEQPNDLQHLKFKGQECPQCQKPILKPAKSRKSQKQVDPEPEVVALSSTEGLLSKTELKAIAATALIVFLFIGSILIRDANNSSNNEIYASSSSLTSSKLDNETNLYLCRLALNGSKSGWETKASFLDEVEEVKSRNLTVDACKTIIGYTEQTEDFIFKVCQETSKKVRVAISYSSSSQSLVKGWYVIEPKSCLQISAQKNSFAWYAESDEWIWEGTSKICLPLSSKRDFTIARKNRNCGAKNRPAGFSSIDVRPEEKLFEQTLTGG